MYYIKINIYIIKIILCIFAYFNIGVPKEKHFVKPRPSVE